MKILCLLLLPLFLFAASEMTVPNGFTEKKEGDTQVIPENIPISIISEEGANKLFKVFSSDRNIPFKYPVDGCYARSVAMAQIAAKQNITMAQVFVTGSLQVKVESEALKKKYILDQKFCEKQKKALVKISTFCLSVEKARPPAKLLTVPPIVVRTKDKIFQRPPAARVPIYNDGNIKWGWHVAPVVGVKSPDGKTEVMVFDPSLFDKPVNIQTWKNIMLDSSDNYKTEINKTYFGNQYQYGPAPSYENKPTKFVFDHMKAAFATYRPLQDLSLKVVPGPSESSLPRNPGTGSSDNMNQPTEKTGAQ